VKLLIVLLISVMGLRADLTKVMAEPNLERRSELALKQANERMEEARTLYSDDKMPEFRTQVVEVAELVELSYKSLQDTGKRARKSPKWFKRAELSIRSLLRRVDGLEKDVSSEDRKTVTEVQARVRTVHQQLLHDIMTKK
jgi:hypothetical protein